MLDTCGDQFVNELGRQFCIRRRQQFTRFRVDDIGSEDLALEVLPRHYKLVNCRLVHVTNMLRRNSFACLDDELAAQLDIKRCRFAAQALGNQAHLDFFLRKIEIIVLEKQLEHFHTGHSQRAQDNCDGQFATTVDSCKHRILRIKFEVEPRTTIRNDSRREQQLAGTVRLAFVMVEEHAWRAVQLGYDDTFGTIDYKSTVIGHQRHFTEVNFLFANVLDGFRSAAGFLVVYDQANQYPNGRCKGQATHLTFFDIKNRLAKTIAYVLKGCVTRVADNRENRQKCRMKTFVFTVFNRLRCLQKLIVRVDLYRQQVRYVQNCRTFAKTLANSLFLSE